VQRATRRRRTQSGDVVALSSGDDRQPAPMNDVRIVPYSPRHREPFRELNLAWITEHFRVEDADRRALDDPEGYILAHGGHIFMAEAAGRVVGGCALLRNDDGTFELAKMAVDPAMRGRGVGRALGEAAIDRARALGAPRVELLSNTRLRPAITLYRSLGFVEVPLPPNDYERANIKMVLELRSTT
jgi:GNAT superfamily N-acetyltransferase